MIEGVVANRTGTNASANACLNYPREQNQSLRLIVPQRLPTILRRFLGDSSAILSPGVITAMSPEKQRPNSVKAISQNEVCLVISGSGFLVLFLFGFVRPAWS